MSYLETLHHMQSYLKGFEKVAKANPIQYKH